jgi:hypothetical protein
VPTAMPASGIHFAVGGSRTGQVVGRLGFRSPSNFRMTDHPPEAFGCPSPLEKARFEADTSRWPVTLR